MRVYGLRWPQKSMGRLASLICCGIAVFYPPFASFSTLGMVQYNMTSNAMFIPADAPAFSWSYNLRYTLKTGGFFWQLLAYQNWRKMPGVFFTSDRMLILFFAPSCFVPVTLALSVLVLWRYLVDYALRPSVLRGVLTVLCALPVSLAVIFVLDQIGGRLFIYSANISYTDNLEVRSLIGTIWIEAVLQSLLLALPCMVVGALLAWRQARLGTRPAFARRSGTLARQED